MSEFSQFFGQGFDTHSVEPATDFALLPPGKYPVIVEKAEIKTTKAGNGHYVELTLGILEGNSKGRKVWDRINIDNPNRQCVDIGLRSLAALGQAVGLTTLSSTEQLLNQVCVAHVRCKDEQNEVRTYSPAGQQDAANNAVKSGQLATTGYCAPSSPAPAPILTPAPIGAKPPWAR